MPDDGLRQRRTIHDCVVSLALMPNEPIQHGLVNLHMKYVDIFVRII